MTYQSELTASDVSVAELFLFTLADASVVRLTSYNKPIVFGGNTYAKAPISRTVNEREATPRVGFVQVTIGLSDEMRALFDVDDVRHERILDRMSLTIYRVILPAATVSTIDFKGFSGTLDITNQIMRIEFKDMLFLLKKNLPTDIYGEGCNFIFGSTECGVVINDVKVAGTADAGSDADTLIDAANLDAANGFFERGYVEMTSGDNDGLKRPIITYVVGTITLLKPFPVAIAENDTFTAFPHCQKSFNGCDDFSNTAFFFGFQHLPTKEQVNG